jgi:hypothetical protein
MALDLAPFGRWRLRDKAAQRRSALRWTTAFLKAQRQQRIVTGP